MAHLRRNRYWVAVLYRILDWTAAPVFQAGATGNRYSLLIGDAHRSARPHPGSIDRGSGDLCLRAHSSGHRERTRPLASVAGAVSPELTHSNILAGMSSSRIIFAAIIAAGAVFPS